MAEYEVAVSDEDIARVENWARERRQNGETHRGQTYEEGIIAALDWVFGNDDLAPDAD